MKQEQERVQRVVFRSSRRQTLDLADLLRRAADHVDETEGSAYQAHLVHERDEDGKSMLTLYYELDPNEDDED